MGNQLAEEINQRLQGNFFSKESVSEAEIKTESLNMPSIVDDFFKFYTAVPKVTLERYPVSEIITLPNEDNDLPVAKQEDSNALDGVLKVQPIKNLSPEQKVMAAIHHIQELPMHQRDPYVKNMLEYARENDVKIIVTDEQLEDLNQGLLPDSE